MPVSISAQVSAGWPGRRTPPSSRYTTMTSTSTPCDTKPTTAFAVLSSTPPTFAPASGLPSAGKLAAGRIDESRAASVSMYA